MNGVEVLRFFPYMKGGPLKAFFNLRLGGVTINDCRIIQQDGQDAWVSMPQKEVPQPDGGKQYYPIVKLTENLNQKVSNYVLQEWDKFKSTR